jgi:RNA polymerase sigma-70 factor (ECF subfamily)
VWARVDNQHLAEDLTGEVFTRMVVGLRRYRLTEIPFQAWLYRIASNLVADHYREEGRRILVPLYHAEAITMEGNNPATIVEGKFTAERVKQALSRLDPLQREVVVLRFLIGFPLKDVALALDKTVAAIKSLQYRGLEALRGALEEE